MDNLNEFEPAFFLRSPGAFEIRVRGDDVRFVERYPKSDVVSEFLRDFFSVTCEVCREFSVRDAALFREPQRKRPMPQGDERRDTPFFERVQHVAVVFDGCLVEDAFFRFDARPLDRESVGVVIEGSGDIEILFESVVMVAGDSGNVVPRILRLRLESLPLGNMRELCGRFFRETIGVVSLPYRPIVRVSALDLMRSRRRAPKESFRECFVLVHISSIKDGSFSDHSTPMLSKIMSTNIDKKSLAFFWRYDMFE